MDQVMVVMSAPPVLNHKTFIAMTTLNSRLQLALLNCKKGRNLLEKGFTLVELMIVIVIVGILSAVALPNFLSQTGKAKLTEAQGKVSAGLKQAQSIWVETGDFTGITCADVGFTEDETTETFLENEWTYTCTPFGSTPESTTTDSDGNTITIPATAASKFRMSAVGSGKNVGLSLNVDNADDNCYIDGPTGVIEKCDKVTG